jgi:hypothetical protein
MAAIQEIQSLISQGQPIPEGLQRNALREAAATGMSNADLASTLGVPASMVDDAAATLAATPEIGALPVDRFMPQIPAPSPLAGIAVDNNYSQQEIDQVRGLVDSGAVSIDQVAQNFGVTPNYAAAALGQPMDNMSIQTIDNREAKEIMQSIPATGDYTQDQVETITGLMNAGKLNVSDVSKHFNVDESYTMEVISGVPKETYEKGNFTPAQTQKLESLIVAGVATTPQVAKYFDAPVTDVTDYLTKNTGLTESQVVDSILSDVAADRDYNMSDAEKVKAQIDAGNVTVAQAAKRYQVSEDDVNRVMAEMNATGGTGDTGGTGGTVGGGGTIISDPIDTLNQTSTNTGTNLTSGADLTLGSTDLTYGRDGDTIPTGLAGSETALTGSAADAITLLDTINQAGRTDITGQTQIGLNDLAAGAATARQDITSGVEQGLGRLDTGIATARGDLSSALGQAQGQLSSGIGQARGDISTGSEEAYNRLVAGLGQGRTDLTAGFGGAADAIRAAQAQATGQIQQGTTQGLEAFNQGIGQGRQDITGAFGRAEGMFDPYREAGTTALQQQLALSGALGQDAFNQAYQESPQMAFLREQGMRANLAGSAATGGLGGGNVQKELQRFGQGLASQGLQQQIANLGTLSGQGLGASGSAANIATSGGQNLANLSQQQGLTNLQALQSQGQNLANITTGAGQNLANISQGQGQALAGLSQLQGTAGADISQNRGQNLAQLAQALGTGSAGMTQATGANLSNLAQQQGVSGLNTYMTQGQNLANIANTLGINQLNTRTNLGSQLSNYGLSTGLPAVSTVSNLGVNLAQGRTRAGEQLANQYAQAASALGGIYSGQGRDIASMADSQRQMLMNMVQSGALTEAQAQQAYSTNMANLQSGIGGQLAGVPNAPIFSPDYGQQIGQAFEAAGIGDYLSRNRTPADVVESVGVVPNQSYMYQPNLGIPANQFNFDR